MLSTEKLLSIKNLKKYFPIAKSSIFQKEQYYVRANEEITLDIHKGETFGLVGESGCGKSTLGRTLLQLYDQTAGSTMYYGKTISEVVPQYAIYTLKNVQKMKDIYNKHKLKAEQMAKICEEAGDKATFIQLQDLNLANCETETAFQNMVKVLGGITVLEDYHEGTQLYLKKFEIDVKIRDAKEELIDCEARKDLVLSNINDITGDEAEASKNKKKLEGLNKKHEKIEAEIVAINGKIAEYQNELDEQNKKIQAFNDAHADNPEFVQYETYRDDGVDLSRLKYSEMRLLRKDIQIIFQDPYSSLNPRMTVGQIIEEGLVTHNFFKHGSAQMQEYILDVMRQCGLQDYMIHRYPHQFSGGQRQRICIARALAVNPNFVVCDECVSALDVSIQSQIINLLEELKEKQNLTYLFISHDLSVVRYISDRIGVMYLGNMVELGTAETVFADPRHPYTVALLSSIPTTDAESVTKDRIILEGNIPSPVRPPDGCKFHTRCYMACDVCKRVPPPVVEVEEGHFVACHFIDRKVNPDGSYVEGFIEKLKTGKASDARKENDLEKTENKI